MPTSLGPFRPSGLHDPYPGAANASLGFLEKLTFLGSGGLDKYATEAFLVNFTALVVVLFGASVMVASRAPRARCLNGPAISRGLPWIAPNFQSSTSLAVASHLSIRAGTRRRSPPPHRSPHVAAGCPPAVAASPPSRSSPIACLASPLYPREGTDATGPSPPLLFRCSAAWPHAF
jgi:hypothetical protein